MSSFYNCLHSWKFQQLVLGEFLTTYSLSSLWCCTLSSCGCFGILLLLRFRVNSPMLFLFIYNFGRFKWWCCGCLAIHNIVARFINTLFQVNSSLSSYFCSYPTLLWKIGNAIPSWDYCIMIYTSLMNFFGMVFCKCISNIYIYTCHVIVSFNPKIYMTWNVRVKTWVYL